MKVLILCSILLFMLLGCAAQQTDFCRNNNDIEISKLLMSDLTTLSSANFQGRKPGTPGSKLAQQWLVERFRMIGLTPFEKSFSSTFTINDLFNGYQAANIIGYISGRIFSDRYIVVSAHYDHLGTKGSRVYHGADDNASGVAAMLALARTLKIKAPKYSVIFLASDAEEKGLLGAKHFLEHPPVPIDNIVFNLNLDMLGRGHRLNMVGSKQFPEIMASAKQLSKVCLTGKRLARQKGSSAQVDYRRASDHWAFFKQGIPYLFLGGAMHADYHLPSDVPAKISPSYFSRVSQAVAVIYGVLESELALLTSEVTK